MAIEPALSVLIRDLGTRMGLSDLSVGEDGLCALKIDDRFVVGVHCSEADDQLWLFSDLGVPAIGADMYPHLLRSNLFWQGTLGATLSLTHDEPPRVVIAQPVHWDGKDAAYLSGVIEIFVDTIEAWSDVVASSVEDSAQGTQANLAPVSLMQSRA